MERISKNPMISLLLTMRKNSKFFPKFMAGFLTHTKNFNNVELLIMASEHDTWNEDLFELWKDKITVFREDWKVGKNGRHYFYNELAKSAKGDWLWHMCDDHYLLDGYDEYLVNYINESGLDSKLPMVIVPRVENSGSIAHIISRGWYEKTGRIGMHGNIDSYLNEVISKLENRIDFHPDKPILWDYTTDPTIMTSEHTKTAVTNNLPVYDLNSPETKRFIDEDIGRLE